MTDATDIQPIIVDVETRTAGRVRVDIDEMIVDLQAEKVALEDEIKSANADETAAKQRARVARERINTIKRVLSAVNGRPERKPVTTGRQPKTKAE